MYFVDSSISRNILRNFVEMKQLNENESLKIGKKIRKILQLVYQEFFEKNPLGSL